jgi:hypothetical protein
MGLVCCLLVELRQSYFQPVSMQGGIGCITTCSCCCSACPLALLQHPSLEPGIGRRWGWNVQYAPPADAATAATASDAPTQSSSGDSSSSSSSAGGWLQHIHHTSLGMLLVRDVQQDMQPGGPQTLPPAGNIK